MYLYRVITSGQDGKLSTMSDTHAPPFEDRPPDSDRVTPHDELHLVTYLRMPDAKAGGTDWREVVRTVFGLDPDHSDRARQIYGTHLARAG